MSDCCCCCVELKWLELQLSLYMLICCFKRLLLLRLWASTSSLCVDLQLWATTMVLYLDLLLLMVALCWCPRSFCFVGMPLMLLLLCLIAAHAPSTSSNYCSCPFCFIRHLAVVANRCPTLHLTPLLLHSAIVVTDRCTFLHLIPLLLRPTAVANGWDFETSSPLLMLPLAYRAIACIVRWDFVWPWPFCSIYAATCITFCPLLMLSDYV